MAAERPLDFYPHRTFDKLRYGDTDRQGHVNNAVFTTFLETGRVEILFEHAHPAKPERTSFVIARLELDFRAEVNFPGSVDIGTRVLAFGRSSFRLDQSVFQNGVCVATAETVIVLMDDTTRKSTPLPEAMIERLARYLRPDN
jgi:acyl-CoA thioester hydrolase